MNIFAQNYLIYIFNVQFFAQNLKKCKINDLMKYRTDILKNNINHSYRLTFEYILGEKSPMFSWKINENSSYCFNHCGSWNFYR